MTEISRTKQFGAVSSDDQRDMGGLEFVQGLVTGLLPLNTMARTLGYDIVEASEGRVIVTATPNAEQLNPQGTVHGGLSATLLDTCMGLALHTTLEKGLGSTTLEFKISFLRPLLPDAGQIRAEGLVLNRGRTIGSAEGKLTDCNDRLIAHATTTCLIFSRLAHDSSAPAAG